MENIFNRPHNRVTDPGGQEFIGGYIYQKFVRSGLLVATQDFVHEIPVGDLANQKGSSSHVVSIEFKILSHILQIKGYYNYVVSFCFVF